MRQDCISRKGLTLQLFLNQCTVWGSKLECAFSRKDTLRKLFRCCISVGLVASIRDTIKWQIDVLCIISMSVSFRERIRQCSIVQTSFESCIKYKNYNAHLHLSIKMSHPYYSRSNLLSFTPHQKSTNSSTLKSKCYKRLDNDFLITVTEQTFRIVCMCVCVSWRITHLSSH